MKRSPRPLRSPPPRDAGFGLVEIIVGVAIGLLTLLIIYQALALAEGYKRTTTAGGDAQSAGMISTFILGQEIGNAGNGVSSSALDLANCPSTGEFATTWRPIPVLIRDGGGNAASDSFDVFYGVNSALAASVNTTRRYEPGGTLDVQSPMGFGAGHLVVVVDRASGRCAAGTVAALAGPDPATGIVNITPTPIEATFPQGSTWVVSLGPADRVRKARYDVRDGVVRSRDLMNPDAVPNPIVGNVVLMKAQYGLDTNLDQSIDTWVSAGDPDWNEASVLAAPLTKLRQIKAIRVALIVRSTQFERPTDAEGRAAVTDLSRDFTVTLFDCRGLAPCSGELADVTLPGTANYRHRVFEQVIPLRNQIWNAL